MKPGTIRKLCQLTLKYNTREGFGCEQNNSPFINKHPLE